MTDGSWDPFKDLLSLQERMNQLFEESLARRSGLRAQADQWHPPVDIVETDEMILLTAELPGLEIQEITLEISNQHLTLRGERAFAHSSSSELYHQLERVYGKFGDVWRSNSSTARWSAGLIRSLRVATTCGRKMSSSHC